MDSSTLSEAIVQELGQCFVQALQRAGPTLVSADLDGMERQVQALGRQVLGRVVEQAVAVVAAAPPAEPPRCPQCQQPLRLVEEARERHLQGLVGEYRLVRAYWHCAPCRQGCAPLDAVLGLGAGALSPGLSRVACRLGIEAAFAPAADILSETLQVDVPNEAVRRITEGIGQVAEAEQQAAMAAARGDQEPPAPEVGPAQLLVAVDGVTVHTDGDWHEMKVGVVAPLGPTVRTEPDTARECFVPGPQSLCAGLEPATSFWWRVYCEARRRGLGAATVALVVVLGDGADWIWKAAARFLHVGRVEFVEIVDIYHAWAAPPRPPGSRRSNGACSRPASAPCWRPWGSCSPRIRRQPKKCGRRGTTLRTMRRGWTTRSLSPGSCRSGPGWSRAPTRP
jgi:hypothetical protein